MGIEYETFASTLASDFVPSAHVDILLFSCLEKPCVRTRLHPAFIKNKWLEAWCAHFCLHYRVDDQRYIYFSREKDILQSAYQLDHSTDQHATELGRILGYPSCCSEFIEKIGEERIDEIEESYRCQKFEGDFALINPCFYLQGSALISHIPCSPYCANSLSIAMRVKGFLLSKLEKPCFQQYWKMLTEKLRNV